MAKIGELREKEELSFVVEWKINNFFGLPENVYGKYFSPSFSFANTSWYLNFYMNREVGAEWKYMSLYLNRKSPGKPLNFEYILGLKNANGDINPLRRNNTYALKNFQVYGFSKFLSRSELLKRKSELAPGDDVTVVCTLKYPANFKATEFGKAVRTECLYCKATLDTHDTHEDITFHLQNCTEFPIKCPKCEDVFTLKNWHDHKCQTAEAEANEKLLSDFKSMLMSGDHSDAIIRVKGEEFKLHRSVLASRSPYFHSMFNCSMMENNTGNVTIDDCEPDVFRSFVHFVYTGKVDQLTLENVCDLYELADKYQEDQLKTNCLHFMMSTLSADNFCDFAVLAFRHNEKKLLEKAINFFAKNTKEIIRNVKWQILLTDYPIQANELLIKAIN